MSILNVIEASCQRAKEVPDRGEFWEPILKPDSSCKKSIGVGAVGCDVNSGVYIDRNHECSGRSRHRKHSGRDREERSPPPADVPRNQQSLGEPRCFSTIMLLLVLFASFILLLAMM
jgi:hypothetical protein